MSSYHGDRGGSGRSAKRKLRRHHARPHTASCIPSEPPSDYSHRGHVRTLLFGRQKTTQTEELICIRRKQKRPYSAISVAIDNLSDKNENDVLAAIPELVEVIRILPTGPAEAARAIRKKLKYGTVHRQLRALDILDGLIQNAGAKFQRTFADQGLLERLRICGTSDLSDPAVKAKCKELFRSWSVDYSGVGGMEEVCALYKQLPRTKKVVTQDRSKVLRETEENPFDDDELETPAVPAGSPAGPSNADPAHSRQTSFQTFSRDRSSSILSSSNRKSKKEKEKDKKKKRQPFNLEAEKESMKATIADSAVASTNLLNALRHINREKERISENKTALQHFDNCKLLRRKILRYIQHVEAEEWLGGLLHANDELIYALLTFEQLDRSIDADSDSDDDMAEQAHLYKMAERHNAERKSSDATTQQLAGLSIGPKSPLSPTRTSHRPAPPTPVRSPQAPESEEEVEEDDDENDPFADRNALV
ncbi:hypothetical protein DSL72_007144 [Monilinia vaccinii-corymbosi]|uniref:VHS domain-containing protein n=1 Tax=Monilinia vaccinii-corymbosi TaxID=61207 RepID=A0A8A3PLL0_9HELO|nr:hypothetical protein DSL72_007144 [Monilinia vaccinii-corymbosi]